jgi:sterol 3beta-glucosyltransferase
MILRAAQIGGLRVVAALPRQAFPAGAVGEQVFCLEDVPHAWLFPRCSALVHHGGSGTTAAGLRAGVPALLIPRATDQFFWGSRVHSLGCGPDPLPQRALSAEKLARGMLQAVSGSSYQLQSATLGEKIRSEQGVENAVRLISAKLT